MNKKKYTICLLGARGMLGREFSSLASASGYDVIGFDLPEFDICNPSAMETAVDSAEIIVNCAAYTNVDGAESEQELCRSVNATAVRHLGDFAAAKSKYVLHTSTDFVYGDGTLLPHNEDEEPSPMNFYGRTKLEGERFLVESGAESCVIRIEWTYGLNGRNFITKIIERATKGDVLTVVDDQVGGPTWTAEVSRAIICLIEKRVLGIYNFAADGYVSRYELAKFALSEYGIDTDILPCSSSEIRTPARRPLNSRFDCSKIDGVLDFDRVQWEKSLSEFLSKLKEVKKT